MKQWINISQEHPAVQHLMKRDKRLARLICLVGDIEYKVQTDCFSRLVCSIVNQMLSNKVACVLQKRLQDLCDGEITPKTILKLDKEQLRKTGLSYSKAEYILGIAKATVENKICFEKLQYMTDEEVIKELTMKYIKASPCKETDRLILRTLSVRESHNFGREVI